MDKKLVRTEVWCVSTPAVHGLVAEYHDALHLTTSSLQKHGKKIKHGVDGERFYKAMELEC